MKLEEAKKIIKDIDVLDDVELQEAYNTVLQELEHLQKENEELMNEYHKRVQERIDIEQELKDSISKDKIREKIKELKEMLKKTAEGKLQKYTAGEICLFLSCLEELLKEE